jgi:signal transduction histidine kinase
MSSGLRERLTRTFGSRLAMWYFGLFAASAVLVLGLAYALLAVSLRARDRDVIESTLIRYATAFERQGLRGVNAAIDADVATGVYEPLFVRVLTPAGGVILSNMPRGWSVDLRQLSEPPLLGQQRWAEVSATGGDGRFDVASAILSGGELFQVGKSTGVRDDLLARFRGTAAILLLVVVIAAMAGGATITWSGLRPLRDMTRAVGTILETGHVHARVPVAHSGDPLDDAGVQMNRMLDRIETLIGGLRGSIDHVAHDLRTPVARLRATAETALTTARSADEYRHALADCLEESERVVAILDALMDIAEAESGVMRLKTEGTDLVALLRSVIDLYADLAEEKRIELRLDASGPIPATVDPVRMRQAVANLVDNALKYTPAGGQVLISAPPGADGQTIRVADTGIGISPTDLPHIWDRLYRGDRSRSERGLGLGLTLVKSIVEAHGGQVEVESAPHQGSRFTIRIPDPPRQDASGEMPVRLRPES